MLLVTTIGPKDIGKKPYTRSSIIKFTFISMHYKRKEKEIEKQSHKFTPILYQGLSVFHTN